MQLGQGATPFAAIDDLAGRLTGSPVVVVLGPTYQDPSALGRVEKLLIDRREVGAILVTTELTTELLQQALRAGIKDVLAAPVDTRQFLEAVRRVAETLTPATPRVGGGEEVLEGDGELGRIITVFSTKGGAGKSVISSN